MGMRLAASVFVFALLVLVACGDDGGLGAGTPTPGATSTARPATATPSPTASAVPATPTARPPGNEPLGFPIDPAMRLGLVEGPLGTRTIRWGAGPAALSFTRDDQPSADAERANRSGWNCRTHVEYEGQAAVDWYVPSGTSIRATMDGTAKLYIVTVTNAFDAYGVDREPYLGNPDRERAAVVPFPGPGGGKGVFVRVENEGFVSDYAHLDVTGTVALVPAEAFLSGYSGSTDYLTSFAPLRDYRELTSIARWQVRRGDAIGVSGDSGYSEAPHLHYTVRRAGSSTLLCPTSEAGFGDGGWVVR